MLVSHKVGFGLCSFIEKILRDFIMIAEHYRIVHEHLLLFILISFDLMLLGLCMEDPLMSFTLTLVSIF